MYIGIDPGLQSGSWGAIDHHGKYVACGDIANADGRVDARALKDALQGAIGDADAQIVIESVFCMPAQGASSTAKFMRAAGCIEAVAQLLPYPVHFVMPQVWKRFHQLLKTPKSVSLAMARAYWPDAPLKLAKHHNRGDALLLALWGRNTLA